MGFRYQLRTADGDDAGEGEWAYQPQAGDEVYLNGNRKARVLSVIPVELAGEFVDRPVYGVLEVEPL